MGHCTEKNAKVSNFMTPANPNYIADKIKAISIPIFDLRDIIK